MPRGPDGTRSPRRTCGSRPGWRSPTAGGATRSTRRASTRTPSTRRWPTPGPTTTARRTVTAATAAHLRTVPRLRAEPEKRRNRHRATPLSRAVARRRRTGRPRRRPIRSVPAGWRGRASARAAPTEPFGTPRLEVPGIGAGAAGRRSRARSERGRVVGSNRPSGTVTKLHLADTVLAAAPHQVARGRTGPGLRLAREDLRQATLEGREGNLVLFLVDASGSIGSRARMGAVKGAVLSLLLDAYQRRDKVGLVTFRGSDAELALPPTWSVEAAAARLTDLPTGGRTPLAAGLLRAHEVLRVEHVRDPQRRPLLVVVTDGRATGPRGGNHLGEAHAAAGLLAAAGTASVVVDCESGPVRLGLAATLGTHLGGPTLRLEELAADTLAATVRGAREAA